MGIFSKIKEKIVQKLDESKAEREEEREILADAKREAKLAYYDEKKKVMVEQARAKAHSGGGFVGALKQLNDRITAERLRSEGKEPISISEGLFGKEDPKKKKEDLLAVFGKGD